MAVGRRRVSLLGCGTDEGLHRVLGRQAKRLGVHLVRVSPVVGYPKLLAPVVVPLLVWVEIWGRGDRVARCRAGGGGDGVWSLELAARPDEGAIQPLHRLLLDAELHQVKVADEIHGNLLQSQV